MIPYSGTWDMTRKIRRVVAVHRALWLNGILRSGGVTSGRMPMKGRTSSRKRTVRGERHGVCRAGRVLKFRGRRDNRVFQRDRREKESDRDEQTLIDPFDETSIPRCGLTTHLGENGTDKVLFLPGQKERERELTTWSADLDVAATLCWRL